jgi:mycothiol synthase
MPANSMSNSSYNIRNYQPADFEKYVLLIAKAEKLEPTGRCVSPRVVAEQLERPNYSPEQDLFMVGTKKDIVGYMDVKSELTIGRVVLDCWIDPEHRRRGLATKLLGCAEVRSKLLGTKAVHVNVSEDNIVAVKALRNLGFNFIRRFLELGLATANIGQFDMAQAAPDCRYIQPGEEDKLAELQNRTFAGTWGYNPNTVEEIAFCIKLNAGSPEDICLIYEGDKAIGYCWTGISCEDGTPSTRKGRILMLGVRPDCRGKGIGKKLVLAGLAHLKNKGLQFAELTVDSENKTACALYQSIGFEVETKSFWYEKLIN